MIGPYNHNRWTSAADIAEMVFPWSCTIISTTFLCFDYYSDDADCLDFASIDDAVSYVFSL